MGKIKVLHIAQSNGGVSEYLKMYFKYSNNEYFENELLCSKLYQEEEEEYEELGVKLKFLDVEREINIFKDIKTIIQAYKVVKRIKPNIIYCHSSKAGVFGRIVAKLLNIPVIYNAHGWAFNMKVSSAKKILFVLIEKVLAFFTDMIVAISKDEMETAIKNKIPFRNNITLIHNGIDIKKSDFTRSRQEIFNELGIDTNSIVIGMVARVSEQKDPITFVNISKKICEKYPNVCFVYVGDGDLKEKTMKLIDDYKLNDKIIITGWKKDVKNYINIFDVGLLTSIWEGFGLVVLEYMLLKKPVIASNVGGIKDIIVSGDNGILVEPKDVDGFVENINRLITNTKEKKHIIEKAYSKVILEYDVKELVNKHEKLINSILNKGERNESKI